MTFLGMRMVALALLLVPFGPAASASIGCPLPGPRPGMIAQTPAQWAELESALTRGDVANQVAVRSADLRRRFPAAGNAELMNIFTMAYCPSVMRLTGLDDAEKQARLDLFSVEISPIIYQGK